MEGSPAEANGSMFESVFLYSSIVIGLFLLSIPIVVRTAYRFSASCKGTRLSVNQLPAEAAELIASRMPPLEALGFHIAGCYDFGQLTMETRTIVATFTHGQTQESANVWLSVSTGKTSSYLEFSTQTPNGILLETNSNGILPLAPENEEIRVFRFPEISGVAELHRVHRQIVAKYSGGPWIGDAPQGVAIERVTRTIEGYAPRLCKLGYLRLAENGKSYRLTWKGAFRVALNGIWPVSAVRRFIARYEMRNELRSLEVHGLARLAESLILPSRSSEHNDVVS
jgi:hypothetical protein